MNNTKTPLKNRSLLTAWFTTWLSALVLVFSLVSIPVCATEIVKWVDKHGKVHYGDAPPKDKNVETEVIDAKEAPKLGLSDEELAEQRRRTRQYKAELEQQKMRETTAQESQEQAPKSQPQNGKSRFKTREDCRNAYPSRTAARVRCFKSLE